MYPQLVFFPLGILIVDREEKRAEQTGRRTALFTSMRSDPWLWGVSHFGELRTCV